MTSGFTLLPTLATRVNTDSLGKTILFGLATSDANGSVHLLSIDALSGAAIILGQVPSGTKALAQTGDGRLMSVAGTLLQQINDKNGSPIGVARLLVCLSFLFLFFLFC